MPPQRVVVFSAHFPGDASARRSEQLAFPWRRLSALAMSSSDFPGDAYSRQTAFLIGLNLRISANGSLFYKVLCTHNSVTSYATS